MKLPAGFVPRRVAILRPRGLGDIVLSSAVIDALGLAYPGVAIDFVAERPARDILARDDRLDGTYLVGLDFASTRAVIRWLRSRRPDLVVDLFSNPRTALITAFSGARYRIGLDKRARRLAYNVRVPRRLGEEGGERRWAAEVQLDFLREAGVRWEGEARPSVALTDEDYAFAERALRELNYAPGAPFGAVLPGGSWESKRWSVEGFAAAARELYAATGQRTLVLWGPPEREEARGIVAAAGEDRAVLAPPSTLREMAALLAKPALLVVTDCLARHFAIVQGVPTIGLFGTTEPDDWTPPFGPHQTLRGGPPEGYESLRAFPSEPVLEAIRDHFREAPLDSPPSRP